MFLLFLSLDLPLVSHSPWLTVLVWFCYQVQDARQITGPAGKYPTTTHTDTHHHHGLLALPTETMLHKHQATSRISLRKLSPANQNLGTIRFFI